MPVTRRVDFPWKYPGLSLILDRNKLLVKLLTIEDASQGAVPHSMLSTILYWAHPSSFAGHPEERRAYDKLWRE